MKPEVTRLVVAKFQTMECPAIITKVTDWEQSHRINVTVFPDGMRPECYADVRLFSCRASAEEFMTHHKDTQPVPLVCYWPGIR